MYINIRVLASKDTNMLSLRTFFNLSHCSFFIKLISNFIFLKDIPKIDTPSSIDQSPSIPNVQIPQVIPQPQPQPPPPPPPVVQQGKRTKKATKAAAAAAAAAAVAAAAAAQLQVSYSNFFS